MAAVAPSGGIEGGSKTVIPGFAVTRAYVEERSLGIERPVNVRVGIYASHSD